MTYIELSGKTGEGKRTKVDQSTLKEYGHLSWYLGDTGYAMRKTRDGIQRLHRVVTNCPEDKVVDHLNGDKLDNRRSNLRICTHKDNAMNRKGVKGYCWDKEKQMWMVTFKGMFYGRYKTELEAVNASRRARSGVPRPTRGHARRKYLPKGVYFMQPMAEKGQSPYYIRPCVKGKKYFKGYFSNVGDAERAYIKLIKELQQGG